MKEIEAKAFEAIDNLNREENLSISNRLFDLYGEKDILTRGAIVYLLKNGCKIESFYNHFSLGWKDINLPLPF